MSEKQEHDDREFAEEVHRAYQRTPLPDPAVVERLLAAAREGPAP